MKRQYRCHKCEEAVIQHWSGERPVRTGAADFFGDRQGCTHWECSEEDCPCPRWGVEEGK